MGVSDNPPNKQLWRFTRFLDYVLIDKGDGQLTPISPGQQTFVVIGHALDPRGEKCLAGEVVGGPNCGTMFLLAPGDEANWEQIAVKA